MRIAITGAGGQLGGELCRQLGDAAVGLDHAALDVTDRDELARVLGELEPDVVINAAAYTAVDRAEAEPEICRRVNVDAVELLAAVCNGLDCRLLHMSTDYVFGGDASRRTPYGEGDTPAPRGVYAQSKLAGERRAAECERHFVVRTCGLYGPRGPRSSGNFVDTMVRLGRQGGSVRVVDDQRCTPSYTVHVARGIAFLLSTDAYGTYHVVNSGETTWCDMAREIFRRAGIDAEVIPITTADYGAAAPRPAYSVLDTSKYRALGGPPLPSWQEALAEYLAGRGDQV